MNKKKQINVCKYCGRETYNKTCKKCNRMNKKSLRDKIFEKKIDIEYTFINLLKLYKVYKMFNYELNNSFSYIKWHIHKSSDDIYKCLFKIKNNKWTSNMLGFKLRYGEKEGTIRYNLFVESTKHNLDTYIAKHGDIKIAEEEYKKYCYNKTKKIREHNDNGFAFKCTNESFIEKYGLEEGTKRYENYINAQIISSKRRLEYWLNKGYNLDEAKIKLKDHQSTFSKDKCIKKYGKIVGLIRWTRRQIKWQKTLKSKSAEEIEIMNKKKGNSLENFIEKYGQEEGAKRYEDKCLKYTKRKVWCKGLKLIDYYTQKHGYNGIIKYKEFMTKRTTNNCMASKESLSLLLPFYDKYKDDYNIYIGLKPSKEYFIYDNISKRVYFYDFTIPDLKIIIEYNGEAFHPNPNWDDNKWNNWKSIYSNQTADEKYEFDTYKNSVAISKGYKVLQIWSSDTEEYNKAKIEEFISSSI